MAMRVTCPGCRDRFRVEDTSVGQAVTCDTCGARFKVSAPAGRKPAPEAAPPNRDDDRPAPRPKPPRDRVAGPPPARRRASDAISDSQERPRRSGELPNRPRRRREPEDVDEARNPALVPILIIGGILLLGTLATIGYLVLGGDGDDTTRADAGKRKDLFGTTDLGKTKVVFPPTKTPDKKVEDPPRLARKRPEMKKDSPPPRRNPPAKKQKDPARPPEKAKDDLPADLAKARDRFEAQFGQKRAADMKRQLGPARFEQFLRRFADMNPGRPQVGFGRGGPRVKPPEHPVDPPAAGHEGSLVVRPSKSVDMSPAQDALTGDKTVRLPSAAASVCLGGNGRYVLLTLPRSRMLAVYDARLAKVAKYLPLAGDKAGVAAGMTKFFVILPTQNLIQRYDLATFEREVTAPMPAQGTFKLAMMGHATDGPLMVGVAPAGRFARSNGLTFIDTKTLREIDTGKQRGGRAINFGYRSSDARVSANGEVIGHWSVGLSPSGLRTLVISGGEMKGYDEHTSAGAIIPAPDGSRVFTSKGIYTPELRPLDADAKSALPAAHGRLYVRPVGATGPRSYRSRSRVPKPAKLTVHLFGDSRPLFTLTDVKGMKWANGRTVYYMSRTGVPYDKRLFYIPMAKQLVTLPDNLDRLHVRRVDLAAELAKSTVDFLFVASDPVLAAARGETYRYKILVASRKGGVKVKLEAGPAGMKLSANRELSWRVPSNHRPDEERVLLSVSDSSGQEVFHQFVVKVYDKADMPAGADRQTPPLVDTLGLSSAIREWEAGRGEREALAARKAREATLAAARLEGDAAIKRAVRAAGAAKQRAYSAVRRREYEERRAAQMARHRETRERREAEARRRAEAERERLKPVGDDFSRPGRVLRIAPSANFNGRRELALDGTVRDTSAGGAGRFLLMAVSGANRQVRAVLFDAVEAKLYTLATGRAIHVAAGYDKALIFFDGGRRVERWDLLDRKREAAATLNLGGPLLRALMGSQSRGPVCLLAGLPARQWWMNTASLKTAGERGATTRTAQPTARLSADGRLITAVVASRMVLMDPTDRRERRSSSFGSSRPIHMAAAGPFGRRLFTDRAARDLTTNRTIVRASSGGFVPARHSDIFAEFGRGGSLKFYLPASTVPFGEMAGIDVQTAPRRPTWPGPSSPLTPQDVLHVLPAANLVVHIPPTLDRVVMTAFDFAAALKKHEHLYVGSVPTPLVQAGQEYRFKADFRSSSRSHSVRMTSRPSGMRLERGYYTWKPTRAGEVGKFGYEMHSGRMTASYGFNVAVTDTPVPTLRAAVPAG